ncbi:hypothetical protein [Roseicyclus persicicus]|uniref:Uncharacterized protein n=1 Tax=Roseicyclus persicicus TaxID=2650661 RepID=A0A7X6H0A3_9RHOB|nr:hypothetical protein [Roseibacterium persicicum]NKX45666.1 hypothetical protein [Roseibacterium persicicum]
MYHTAALVTSLGSLALVCLIYYCNLLSRPGSWLRSETLGMMVLSTLTGLYPIALGTTALAMWSSLSGGVSLRAFLSAGVDLVSVAAVIATALVFRALVKETYRRLRGETVVTPFTPKPRGTPDMPSPSTRRAA